MTPRSGCFVFETDHLSRYLLVHAEQAMDFTDVPTNAWYAGSVVWAMEQGHHLRHVGHHLQPRRSLYLGVDGNLFISGCAVTFSVLGFRKEGGTVVPPSFAVRNL